MLHILLNVLEYSKELLFMWKEIFNTFLLLICLTLHLLDKFFLALPYGLWDLSSSTRDWTWPLAVKVQSSNHWVTREFLRYFSIETLFLKCDTNQIAGSKTVSTFYNWIISDIETLITNSFNIILSKSDKTICLNAKPWLFIFKYLKYYKNCKTCK